MAQVRQSKPYSRPAILQVKDHKIFEVDLDDLDGKTWLENALELRKCLVQVAPKVGAVHVVYLHGEQIETF